MAVLHLDEISKYFGAIQAPDGVCLDIKAGKVCALMGNNGAGMSTLVKIIAGAQRHRGDSDWRYQPDGRQRYNIWCRRWRGVDRNHP